MLFHTNSAEETEKIGKLLAEKIDTVGIQNAFIALKGEMGVGKTAFVRGFAAHFDIRGVKSPTYTVVNEYRGRKKIYHFDMYRIESEDDLYSIGYDEYISANAYSIVEWSENITDFIPDGAITVTIERTPEGEGERNITIDMGSKYENISI